jgi:hypothetical protein
MTTSVLVISCLLSAALGVGAAVLTSLVRKSLEVRSADLKGLREDLDHVSEQLAVAEAASNAALHELKLVRDDIRLHELDLSTRAVRAGVRRAA